MKNDKKNMTMIKLIKYSALSSLLVLGASCTDQLRLDERDASFDVNYHTYSRYQLTTAIVNVAKRYGMAVTDAPKGQSTLYFMDCYSSDQIGKIYNEKESNWDFQGSNAYTTELRTLAAVSKLAQEEGNTATVAAADVLKCVTAAFLTEKYGDIPFSEAVQGRSGSLFPKFDSQKEVYESLFSLLDNAAAVLADPASKGLPADHDVLYKGDKTKWLKLANSLKFRLMVHSYEAFKKAGKDLAADMQKIAAGNNYLSSVADNAGLTFSGTDEDQSWYLQTVRGTGNSFTEQKPTKYLIDQMAGLDDPRLYVIFAPVLSPLSAKAAETKETVKINGYSYDITYYPAGSTLPEAAGRDLTGKVISVPYTLDAKWLGASNPLDVHLHYGGSGLPGSNGFYDNRRITGLSKLIALASDSRLKGVIMEADEMMFLLAEARQKGWINSGTVKEYYEKGIRLSFERWKIEDGTKPATHIGSDKIVDNFSAYFAKEGVALKNDASDLDKIAIQKWLAMLMTNHTEAFTEVRRTGKPSFVTAIAPSFSSFSYPMRYTYPRDEASNNKDNYEAAVKNTLGDKDLASVKMWIFN